MKAIVSRIPSRKLQTIDRFVFVGSVNLTELQKHVHDSIPTTTSNSTARLHPAHTGCVGVQYSIKMGHSPLLTSAAAAHRVREHPN